MLQVFVKSRLVNARSSHFSLEKENFVPPEDDLRYPDGCSELPQEECSIPASKDSPNQV